MAEIRENELNHMKNNKDARNSSLLAKYVTNVPESFSKVIKKIEEEVYNWKLKKKLKKNIKMIKNI